MNLQILKLANELKAAIEDRIKYGADLNQIIINQEQREMNDPKSKPLIKITVSFGNFESIRFRDCDERDILETAIARNEREIKQLQKQFDNLK